MKNSTEDLGASVLLAIAEKMVAAKHELDELAVQLSTGKAEARDKFEEIKKDFNSKLNELKQVVQENARQEEVKELGENIAELETVLSAGQVDATITFEFQKKNILSLIAQLEDKIILRFSKTPAVINFTHEIEKFKLKLEILRLGFVLKKFKIKDAFRKGMDEAVGVVRKTESKITRAKARYRNFQDEIRLAYSHMKKAVKKM